MASAGSWPGASRRLNLARARGSSVLEATSTAGASKPMMDSAGLVHSREAMVPVPASWTPSSTEASARYSASVRSTATSSRLTRPCTATLPSASWSVAIRRASSVGASSTGPPNIPGVHGMVQDLHLDGSVHQSAQAGGQGRNAHLPVAGVGHDNHVGAQQFTVGFQERPERRRAGFLLALEEEGHAQAQFVAEHVA